MKAKRLQDLANSLINEIKSKNDCFSTTTIAFPNPLVQQWFVSYWLETQGDAVLMNVEFKLLNDVLPYLVKEENYKLIKKDNLTKVILSIISDPKENIIPKEVKKYYEGDAVKLNDFASSLAELYLDYYKDNFELPETGEFAYQKALFDKIVDFCGDFYFGTIKKPTPKGTSDKEIYLFGFNKLDKIYRYLIDNCNFVKEYSLEVDDTSKVDYTITNAPSMVREIESIHSKICEHLKNGARVSDFYVVAPNIGDYENVIERVFRQNDEEYPSIPFVIRHHNKKESDVCIALKTLYRIAINGFFTRLDFYKLITNPIVQKVRNIDDKEVESWMRSIIDLNLYRNRENHNDWRYLKCRLLLSKVSSINFDENIVSLKEGDYLPYSSISLDDDSILKVVKVIDDLTSLESLLKDKTIITKSLIEDLKIEFDKWFSFSNGENETNQEYKKILNGISTYLDIDDENILLDTFFFSLFENGTINSSQKGNAFTQGITFADFDMNSIISCKYIFFIGASSNSIPVAKIKGELDSRDQLKPNDDLQTLYLLYQNALEKFYISFVGSDLKNDEEFYLSPIVSELNQRESKYLKKEDYLKIELDEKRPYKELFTRKEFNDKNYFETLLKEGSLKKSDSEKEVELIKVYSETVSVYNMVDFLKEPLRAKANRFFNYDKDEIVIEAAKELEPFDLDALTLSRLVNKIILEKLNGTFDYDEFFNLIKLENSIPAVSDEYLEEIYDDLVKNAEDVVEFINTVGADNGEIIPPMSLKFTNSLGEEWTLTSNKSLCVVEEGSDRNYIEVSTLNGKIGINDFLSLYIMALMDLTTLEDGSYNVTLSRGIDSKPVTEKNKDRNQWKFSISSSEAKNLLSLIYESMCDYSVNRAVPLGGSIKKIPGDFSKLKSEMIGQGGAWEYYEQKSLFIPEKDYGYNPQTMDASVYIEELNKQIDLIKFLERIEEGENEDE